MRGRRWREQELLVGMRRRGWDGCGVIAVAHTAESYCALSGTCTYSRRCSRPGEGVQLNEGNTNNTTRNNEMRHRASGRGALDPGSCSCLVCSLILTRRATLHLVVRRVECA